ncbi:hypothetical protein BZA05DRAFT_385025 [Tricharina praecox]|uniref:uncharacterized protein n=1 Tax=Tricharina praecox TaxID=43433 RepID=UPI002220E8E4|nr:uncharacterized protein BZA05DRAFT_385025 [Tricharina praecox]KAI5857848.1 hypothetical protein BZA05DRAFT_385025 [Tricharina praecox]
MSAYSQQPALLDPLPLSPPKKEDELPVALQDIVTAAITEEVLGTVLERHVQAHKPKEPRVVALTADSISIYYLQPVREYWYLPLKQTHTIRIAPLLPVLPVDASETETAKWVAEIKDRITRFTETKDAPVDRFIPPNHWGDWSGVAVFMGFTLLIAAYLLGVGVVEQFVFTTERRFNIAVAVHCGVLIKRSKDVNEMKDLLDKHWSGDSKGRYLWVITSWIEGWRAVSRLRREIARLNLLIAAAEEETAKGTKKESKKKR